MEEMNIVDIEDDILTDLIESGKTVRLIFVNGYQESVRILEYGAETLLVQNGKGEKMLTYIHAVSTINMG